MRLVLASSNAGKLAELSAQLEGLGFELILQSELGLSAVEETGADFAANALLKARHASAGSGLPALADDSGLEVDALGGRPGIHSARFAGPGAGAQANNRKLIRMLSALPGAPRGARFRCVLALVRSAADPRPLLAEGVWEGRIIDAPRGAGGFGYDPHFWLPALEKSAAELDPQLKNQLSHRGEAVRRLRAQIEHWT